MNDAELHEWEERINRLMRESSFLFGDPDYLSMLACGYVTIFFDNRPYGGNELFSLSGKISKISAYESKTIDGAGFQVELFFDCPPCPFGGQLEKVILSEGKIPFYSFDEWPPGCWNIGIRSSKAGLLFTRN